MMRAKQLRYKNRHSETEQFHRVTDDRKGGHTMIRVHSDVEAVGENLLGEGGRGKEDEEEEDSEEEEAGGCGGRPSGELLQFAQKLPDKIGGNQCTLVATTVYHFK